MIGCWPSKLWVFSISCQLQTCWRKTFYLQFVHCTVHNTDHRAGKSVEVKIRDKRELFRPFRHPMSLQLSHPVSQYLARSVIRGSYKWGCLCQKGGIVTIFWEKKKNLCLPCLSIFHRKRAKFARSNWKIHTESWQSSLTHLFYINDIKFSIKLRIMVYFLPRYLLCKVEYSSSTVVGLKLLTNSSSALWVYSIFSSREALLLEENSRWFVFTDGLGVSLG